ncbi:MAG: hypothetical protein PHI83_04080 [Sphaerochaetaceae bacterium]|jgi:hypothetical protein|nr:hypothetical protein [Sphaerochaetaceae bacterium]
MKKIEFSRSLLIRIIAIVLVIALGIVMYFIGRQHSILIDNKDIVIDSVTYPAYKLLEVKIDDQKAKELSKRDRIEVIVTAQKHTLTVVDSMKGTGMIVYDLNIPVKEDMMLLSLPALLAGLPIEKCLTHYEVASIAPPAEEEVIVSETDALLGDI